MWGFYTSPGDAVWRAQLFAFKRKTPQQRQLFGVVDTETPFHMSISILHHPDSPVLPVLKVKDAKRPHGLVLTETSDTQDGWHLVDSARARLKRMKQAVITSGRLHDESTKLKGFTPYKAAMVTLTYRDDVEWSSRHVSELLKRMRQWLQRRRVRSFRYVWVLELTKRGRPHYHLIVWLPKGISMPKPDKQGWWPHGMTKCEWARRPVGYLAKYASKGQILDENGKAMPMPDGARIYGVGGLTADQRDEKSWWLSPGWVRDHWSIADRPRRAIGGGWYGLNSGDWRPSPFEVLFVAGVVMIRRVVDQVVYIDDCINFALATDNVVRDMVKVAPAAGYTVTLYDGTAKPLHDIPDTKTYQGFDNLDDMVASYEQPDYVPEDQDDWLY